MSTIPSVISPRNHTDPSAPAYRVPPNNIELEQALLGAIFVNNEAFYHISDFLEPQHFFEGIHRRIYEIASELIRAGKSATPITLKTFLPGDIDIGGLTASQYLARVAAEATTVINAGDYGDSIYDLATRRSLIEIGEHLVNAAHDMPVDSDPRRIAIGAIEALDGIAATRADAHIARVEIGKAAGEAIRQMHEAIQNPARLAGVTWGLRDIDRATNGLQRGDLIYLAGRPGMGKTGLAVSTSLRAAKAGHAVLFFSMEMTGVRLATRYIADLCYDRRDPITYQDLARGKVTNAQAKRAVDAERFLRTLSIKIEQQPALTVSQLLARARKEQQSLDRRERTLDLVVVDHIHIMQPSDRYSGNRVAELTEISAGLKALAKELNVPVLALAQLSRAVEGREDKRPQLSDLRDSGSLEQDADLVALLYRAEYYLRQPCDSPEAEAERLAKLEKLKNRLEIKIEKQRNGETGVHYVFCDAACKHIDDIG